VLSVWVVDASELRRPLATAVALAIAFVKARYIGLDFMALRAAPRALRLAYEAWALVACIGLIALFLA
jgi:LDH2 family malate/lactate/ureidoglycolate dehydrogenase